MSGTRDTEMAIGAWQPMYTVDESAAGGGPFGDVHAFRMSLWTQHLKIWDPVFRFPATLECTRKVNFKIIRKKMILTFNLYLICYTTNFLL